jgi:hypothetical protein
MASLPASLLALVALVAACDRAPATVTRVCDVGQRPGYFVPGGDDGPLAIIGCARLGVSGRPVEFSAGPERIGGRRQLCVNPAYRGRGRLGIYIPATCGSPSRLTRLKVFSVAVPRQAVRGYELVIWGTVPPATRRLVARHRGGRTTGAVLHVDGGLARRIGAPGPFSAFVVELPVRAACHPIELRAGAARKTLAARPRLC